MSDPDDISAQLSLLRDRYSRQLGEKLDALEAMVSRSAESATHVVLTEIHAELHKMVGSGGTFGFNELSRQARLLERSVAGWLDSAQTVSAGEWEVWKARIQALRCAVEVDLQTSPLPASLSNQFPTRGERPRVALIEDDGELATELCLGLRQFGYDVVHFAGFEAGAAELRASPPDVLVADLMFPGQLPSLGTQGIASLFTDLGRSLPTIVLTSRTDPPAKLEAARVGADVFLAKPVDAPTLAAQIEQILAEQDHQPWRVLIIDDDESLAEHYRLTLEANGMLAEKVCRPHEALEVMKTLNPDMVLLDLYMPECSGAELARVIRYNPEWQGLPIVFLSAEQDLDHQIAALGSGADDFMTKPISDVQLVAAVKVRAKRSRRLSDLMNRDGLTGLLKHASIKERLSQETDRSRRQHKPLATVMVDIDHFKRVNDTWGHPVGDQVIKTLGHMLRQRLRRQDSVGRYGGEEFVAVLPECTAEDARLLLEKIRQSFADVVFKHDGRDFHVTISSGIAQSDMAADAQGLLAAADGALYVAKRGGRNQVRVAVVPAAGTGENAPAAAQS